MRVVCVEPALVVSTVDVVRSVVMRVAMEVSVVRVVRVLVRSMTRMDAARALVSWDKGWRRRVLEVSRAVCVTKRVAAAVRVVR